MQGRPPEQAARDALGQPPEGALAEVRGAPGAAGIGVSGWAVLPPHGHANTSRQLVYVNGRPVAAGTLCRMVDALFTQLYKANARLLDAPQQHRQGNRHAQFLLELSCRPGSCDIAPGPDAAEVVFQDWDAVLAAARLAVLQAWRPALTVAALKQLEQLEAEEQGTGGGAGAARQVAPVARGGGPAAPQAAAGERGSFQEWLTSQTAEQPWEAAAAGHGKHHQQRQQAGPANRGARERGSGGPGSGVPRRSGMQRPQGMAGIKHTLVSRLVRFVAADEDSPGSAAGASVSAGAGAGAGGGSAVKGAGGSGSELGPPPKRFRPAVAALEEVQAGAADSMDEGGAGLPPSPSDGSISSMSQLLTPWGPSPAGERCTRRPLSLASRKP